MQDLKEKAAAVRLVIFDVDGVLTDGSLFIGDDGQIVVDKTKKFQQEKGEWENPDSYLAV